MSIGRGAGRPCHVALPACSEACVGRSEASILKVKTVNTSKSWAGSGFTGAQMSFKAIKLAELRHQGHLRIIVLSDFSLGLPAPAKFSIFVYSSLTEENLKIIICWGAFIKEPTSLQHFKTYFQTQLNMCLLYFLSLFIAPSTFLFFFLNIN